LRIIGHGNPAIIENHPVLMYFFLVRVDEHVKKSSLEVFPFSALLMIDVLLMVNKQSVNQDYSAAFSDFIISHCSISV
jgi:hypothetical protein